MAVDRHADDTARHGALIGILGRHIGRVRPAIAYRHAKPLGRSHGNIRPHCARLFQQGQRQWIGGHNADRLVLMQRRDLIGKVAHVAIGARILEQRAEHLVRRHLVRVAHDHFDAQRRSAGFHHGDILRMTIAIHEKRHRLGFRHPLRHGHRLGAGGRLVQQRRIGDLQPGQVGNHRLEIQQRLKPTLRNLGLIGRIGRVPRRVLKDIALDRGRRHRAMIALPDQRGEHLVLARRHPHVMQQFALRLGAAEIQWFFLTDTPGHRVVDQRLQIGRAHHLQHLGHFLGRGANVAPIGEIIRQIVGWREGHQSSPCTC